MKRYKGFTLIELLVVIAIIALLLSIVMPGLNMAKKKAASAACLSNARSLTVAWYLYQEDNDGLICSSNPGDRYGWVKNPIDENGVSLDNYAGSSPDRVDEADERRGIEKGVLFSYLETSDVFNCPADKRKDFQIPGSDGGFRTYSIPMCLNMGGNSPRQIKKMSDMTSPGTRIAFLEEADQRQYNGGTWGFKAYSDPIEWWDPMAVSHGDSSILGFADGHAERHKWRDPWTKERIEYIVKHNITLYGQVPRTPPEQTQDLQYVYQGWAYRGSSD